MRYQYERIIGEALRTPLAVTPEMYTTIFEMLRFRASGGRLTADELRARIGGDSETTEPPKARRMGVVAVIPVWGVIAHRTFEASSGMTSSDLIGAMFRQALRNDEVSAILLDVSSPGGTVEGVPELADEIFAARGVKPIWALSNAQMGSAAYYLGSQADQVISIPSGETGSVGVYGLHVDESEWLEKTGIKITSFQVGAKKLEGAPWLPLDDEAKAFYQSRVEEAGRGFHAAVARARGVSVADVKKTFGEGRMLSPKEALRVGMIDRVGTFEDTVTKLAVLGGKRRPGMRADVPIGFVFGLGSVSTGHGEEAVVSAAEAERLGLEATPTPVLAAGEVEPPAPTPDPEPETSEAITGPSDADRARAQADRDALTTALAALD